MCEASTCKNLSTILAVEASHEQSARLYRNGIELRHELGDEAGLAECFEGLAASLRALSRDDACVTLLGAAASLRSDLGSLPTPAEHDVVDRLGNAAKADLGSSRFDLLWQRGQHMGLDEIVDFALSRCPPVAPEPGTNPLARPVKRARERVVGTSRRPLDLAFREQP